MVKGKLFQEFKLLEGEKVLWEGGQSKKTIVCNLMEAFATSLLLIFIIFFIVWCLDFHQPTEIEYAEEQKIEQVEKQSEVVDTEKKVHRALTDQYTKRITRTYITIFFFALVFSSWYAYIQFRTAWMLITTERICIQSGALNKSISIVDIDKVVSIVSEQSFIERIFKLHNIEVVHSGIGNITRNGGGNFNNRYKMSYLDLDSNISSQLILNWLPRDNTGL